MPITIDKQAVAFVLIPLAVGCELIVGPTDGHKLFPGESDATTEHQPDDAASDSPGVEVAASDGGASDAGAPATDPDANMPGVDAGGAQDAAPDSGAAGIGIRCGSTRCNNPGDVCCEATPHLDGSACVPSTQCNPPADTIFCSTTAQCTTQNPYCCANVLYTAAASSGQIVSASCAPQCVAGNYGRVTLCDPSDPSSITQCAALDAGCRQLARDPPAYYACQ
jgi:hypothetical protein